MVPGTLLSLGWIQRGSDGYCYILPRVPDPLPHVVCVLDGQKFLIQTSVPATRFHRYSYTIACITGVDEMKKNGWLACNIIVVRDHS